ncbi:putative ATP-dependent RNA helicase DDX20 isoform X1 [Stigmatopora argus]
MAASAKKAAHDIETRTRTDDVISTEGIDFRSLLLSDVVLDGLSAAGFQKPSPIQLKAIPLGRCGLDLIVQAKSGTGKTCVFCTIALETLILENPATQVLVLAPTREIAVQIHSVVMAIGCAMEGLQCHVFIGGRPVSQDKLHLKKCHIAVGSPGRIKQLIELGMLSTASIRLFVLDEADKLLEEGSFQEQINWIFSSLPENKQMLALSATYPESLAQHLTRYMSEPTFVRLNPKDLGLKGLRQYYKLVQSHPLPHKVFEEKVQNLLELFSKIPFNQALVFSNLHTRAQHLADILSSKGLPAVCISGSLSQEQRLEAMSKLKQYQCRVLISTDLTSRGIDAEKVNLVINLDVPQDWETYMHRIGRAGRFGTQGLAVTYCSHGEEENKMLAIAQKCGLNLSMLPSTIDAGLMTEQCDWDVCVGASTALLRARHTRTQRKEEKKVPTKAVSPIIKEELQEAGKPKKTHKLVGPGVEGLSKRANPSQNSLQSPSNAELTRKELQDALPKIPPLSSFKNCGPVFMTFEEAERDFQSFITTGLGRSVEIVRDFTGQGDSDDHTRKREFVTLDDEGGEICRGWKSDPNPAKSTRSSSSSDDDSEEHSECQFNTPAATVNNVVTHTPMEVNHGCSVSQPQKEPLTPDDLITFRMTDGISNKTSPQSDSDESRIGIKAAVQTKQVSLGKLSSKHLTNKKVETDKFCRRKPKTTAKEKKWERAEDMYHMEDEYLSTESYWKECYRAWNDYYAYMSPFQEQSYQGYSAAHNWMTAYRMNTVYIEELLKG